MKERIFIFGALGLLVAALVVLNAASYVQRERVPDSEALPNRSTYATGPTGTRAYHDLLVSTGREVRRWESPVSELKDNTDKITTFVIIGETRRPIENDEIRQILEWVESGGMLVIVDRNPAQGLLETTGAWKIKIADDDENLTAGELEVLLPSVDPSNSTQMISGEPAARPLQPTAFSLGVNAVQPSKFATSVAGARTKTEESPAKSGPKEDIEEPNAEIIDYYKTGPVFHFGSEKRQILVDFPYGSGTIVLLTDPYIVSNGGIKLVDNAQLGLNLLSWKGTIAFDEFHQGYGSDQNRLISYFSGTPVVPVFLQLCLFTGLLMFSKSRRFARALPLERPSRLTKLEYVSAMAQLKKRTKAFDLAIENIYTDFRRRVSRLAGLDNQHTSNADLAAAVAVRTGFEKEEITELMFNCEDIMHGEPTTKKKVLAIASRIREIERTLGLRRGRAAFRK